jgi:glycosyltransferase involved in cell wall biosynthesis
MLRVAMHAEGVRIGVVIAAYNAEPWIADAIASVLRQTHSDWRLVVIDDGSSDGTGATVSTFADTRICLVRQPNAGVSAARNRGRLALPAADACLFLDADDWLAPDALCRLATELAASPDAVAAAGAYTFAGTRRVRRPLAGDILPNLLVRNLFANGGHVLIRASAVGSFRTDIAYGEDWEFWVRLALQGPFITAGGSPVLFVRQHEGGAYGRLASEPSSFNPCMDAIFGNPALPARFGARRLAAIRRRTEAENAWIIGRELIRHGRDGSGWLLRSLRAAPSAKRAALLGAAWLRLGQFAPYAAEPLRSECSRYSVDIAAMSCRSKR